MAELKHTELIEGKEYWLDKCKDEAGIFVKTTENAIYFKPTILKSYSVVKKEDEIDENTVGLVGFGLFMPGTFHEK